MTKTEEALCNGITFSVPRLVPSAIQEGEIEGAMYYVYALITPSYNKLVLKIWEAPDYTPMKIGDENVDTIIFSLRREELSEGSVTFYSYKFSKEGSCYVEEGIYNIAGNVNDVYDGLMLYPGLKCVIVDTIKSIIRKNNE